MHKLNVHKTGLTLGLFLALIHAVWSVLVCTNLATRLLDWKLGMHFLSNPFSVLVFNYATAVELVVLAFVGGYIWGVIFASIWNWAHK